MPKKFNAVEYLVQKYVEGEYAIIPIKIKRPEDFYTRLDPTKTSLAPEISSYIDRCSYHIPVRFKIKLKVICDMEITKEEQEVMDFGTKVHEVLEQMDFKNPNSYLENLDETIKEKIMYFLETPLIKENINEKLYKEYEFTYLEDKTYSHGIIDLLIEREDKMIIVDYKLKNIDDSAYDQQLNGYRKVIKEKTNKEVECYLYSILDSKFRKVEEM